jgi:hypothetical protein
LRTVAIALISNDPVGYGEFVKTLPQILNRGFEVQLCVAAQPPLTPHKFASIKIPRMGCYDVSFMEKLGMKGDALPIINARRESLKIADEKKPDFIFWVDDDMRFGGPSKSWGEDSAQRMIASMDYLDANLNCGLIQHMSFLGGTPAGLEIKPARSGYWETALGLMMRGCEWPYIDERFNFRGAGSDVSLFISYVVKGYYIARNYNNPTKKKASNKVFEGNPNGHYNLEYINSKGMIATMRNVFGDEYKYGRPFPQGIVHEHRVGASLRGFDPFY